MESARNLARAVSNRLSWLRKTSKDSLSTGNSSECTLSQEAQSILFQAVCEAAEISVQQYIKTLQEQNNSILPDTPDIKYLLDRAFGGLAPLDKYGKQNSYLLVFFGIEQKDINMRVLKNKNSPLTAFLYSSRSVDADGNIINNREQKQIWIVGDNQSLPQLKQPQIEFAYPLEVQTYLGEELEEATVFCTFSKTLDQGSIFDIIPGGIPDFILQGVSEGEIS